nr:hypothetical protein [Tanacetum cinerariifolium]
MEASETRVASPHSTTPPSDSTSPLSHDHSPRVTEAMNLSPSSFRKRSRSSDKTRSSSASPASSPTLPLRKRYQGTSEPIVDIETEGNKSEAEGTSSEGEESEYEAPEEPLTLGYRAARRYPLKLAEGTTHSAYNVRHSSRSVLVQQAADETTTPRLLVRTTWEDLVDASLTVPSPVATPAIVEPVDEGYLTELGAQLELHGGILHDHTYHLDELPPTLFEGYGRDFTELFTRSPVLALETWAGRTNAQRAALWQARYEDQREIHALRMQHPSD